MRLSGEEKRQRTSTQIKGELQLIDYLQANNFPVTGYERMKNGQAVIELDGHFGYIRHFIDSQIVVGNPTRQQLSIVGALLGKYHRLVEDFQSNGLRQGIDFSLEATKQYFYDEKENILRSNFLQKQKFVECWQKEINSIDLSGELPLGMLHEDLGKRHVLWQGENSVVFIDFDRAYFGHLILDLGQALRSWCFVDDWQFWSKKNYQIFLQSYERERKLSSLEKGYLSAAIKFAILERALAFATKCVYGDIPDKADERFALDSLFKQLSQIEI